MTQEMTIDGLRQMAERAGLNLSEEELQRLLRGVIRGRGQAAALRELLAAGDEPAGIFSPAKK